MNWTKIKDFQNDSELQKKFDSLVKKKVHSILDQCTADFDSESFFKYMQKLIMDKIEGIEINIQQELEEILEDEDKKIMDGIFKWIDTDLADLIMIKDEPIKIEANQSSESQKNTAKNILLKKKNALRKNKKHSNENKKLKKRRNSSFDSVEKKDPLPVKKVKQIEKPVTETKEKSKSVSKLSSLSSEGEVKQSIKEKKSTKKNRSRTKKNISKSPEKRY